jgi:uncharacterized membrane protein
MRIAEIFLAVLFLFSAMTKAVDPTSFAVQVYAYHVITDGNAVLIVSFVTIAVELMISLAMITGMRLKGLVHAGVILMLLIFTGLIIYSWAFYDLEDCGCLGTYIKMSPLASIIKNLVIIAVTVFAFIKFRKKEDRSVLNEFSGFGRSIPKIVVSVLCFIMVLSTSVYSYTKKRSIIMNNPGGSRIVEQSEVSNEAADAPFANFAFDLDGERIDLGQGQYFVCFYSDTCEHCMETVPEVNELMLNFGESLDFVALCIGSVEGLEEFTQITAPEFPSFWIQDIEFLEFIGNVPPRFYVVRDGQPVKYWDDDLPELEELFEYIE